LAAAGGASISGKSGRTSFRNENAGTPAAGAVEGRLGMTDAGGAASGAAGNEGAASVHALDATHASEKLVGHARQDRRVGQTRGHGRLICTHGNVPRRHRPGCQSRRRSAPPTSSRAKSNTKRWLGC